MSLRVLLYSVTFPGEAGGVQRVARQLAARLRMTGASAVNAWAVDSVGRPADELTLRLPRIASWRDWRPRSVLRNARALTRTVFRIRRFRPDVVNVHFVSREAGFFVRLRSVLGYKLVLSVHGSDVMCPNREDARGLAMLFRRADAVTVVSGVLAERVREIAGTARARIHVIPNGVDFQFWSTGAGEPDAGCGRETVLTVGRLLPVKGQDVLLRALALVRERVPGVRLVVVGDGPARGALEALADELGIRGAVEFAGELGAESIRDRMKSAAAFALPSRSEGLPLALLEAMAAGVPVVATRVGGVPEVVSEGGIGWLVAPEDPKAIAEAMVEMLTDTGRAKQVGRNGQERARQFSARVAEDRYAALFDQLVRGGPR